MPPPIPPHDVQRALQALGVVQQDFETIRRVPFPQAQTLLQELKAKARRNYKRLALELHPDRTQGDEVKAQLFVLLGRVLVEIDKTTVHPPPPPPPQVINFTVVNVPVEQPGASTWQAWQQHANGSTASSAGFTHQQVIRIVRMRPR